jgi:putative tryptophan/tyrosine transport system substrate-binding protein
MQRRAFLAGMAAVMAAPRMVEAQQAQKVYRIGYLSPRPGIELQDEAFRQGLRDSGYVEGQNLVIEWRFAKGETLMFPSLAAELVGLNVDCIVTLGVDATKAAKQATNTIPIIMAAADDDPVRLGLIASFARPGGNVTGIVNVGHELAAKRIQILKELVPKASRFAILWPSKADRGSGRTLPVAGGHLRETQAAAPALRIQLQSLGVSAPDELERAFQTAVRERADGLIVVGTDFINSHRGTIVNLAAKTRIPAIYTSSGWPYEGGLISYATERVTQYRRAASYVGRILKGAKPADLAVEQPTKYELIVNVKVAKALGLTIPPSLLARADEVIE